MSGRHQRSYREEEGFLLACKRFNNVSGSRLSESLDLVGKIVDKPIDY